MFRRGRRRAVPRRVGGNEADFGHGSPHRVGSISSYRWGLTPKENTELLRNDNIDPSPTEARFNISDKGLRVRGATLFRLRALSAPLARRVNYLASHRSAGMNRRRVLALLSASISTVPVVSSARPASVRWHRTVLASNSHGVETPADADTATALRSKASADTDRRAPTGYSRDRDKRGRHLSTERGIPSSGPIRRLDRR